MSSNFVNAFVIFGCVIGTSLATGCTSPGGGGGAVTPTRSDTTGSDGTGDPTACTGTAKRCSGQTAQQCQNGHYVDLFSCPADETCTNGACKAGAPPDTTTTTDATNPTDTGPDTTTCSCVGRECGDDGCGGQCGTCTGNTHCENYQCVTGTCTPQCGGKQCGPNGCGGQCGGCQTGETCQSGQCVGSDCSCDGAVCGTDNCGNTCGFCSGGAVCEGGQCVTASSGGTCQDILDCISDTCGSIADPDAFNVCATDCIAAGSMTGQTRFDDYLGCLNSCPSDDDGSCALALCLDSEVACRFDKHGFGQCIDIEDCLGGCGASDITCVFDCYEAGSVDAQTAYLGLVKCLNIECGDQNPNPDPDCSSTTALPAACEPYLAQCQ